jgi:phosphoribosylamine--glycine ligase
MKKMTILLVGGGGREHAMLHAIKNSSRVDKIYAAPGNAGMADMAELVDIDCIR